MPSFAGSYGLGRPAFARARQESLQGRGDRQVRLDFVGGSGSYRAPRVWQGVHAQHDPLVFHLSRTVNHERLTQRWQFRALIGPISFRPIADIAAWTSLCSIEVRVLSSNASQCADREDLPNGNGKVFRIHHRHICVRDQPSLNSRNLGGSV